VVSPGDVCNISVLRGAWRMAARVPHQAVWKRVSPGGFGPALNDNAEAGLVICLLWMCVVYKALVIP